MRLMAEDDVRLSRYREDDKFRQPLPHFIVELRFDSLD